MKLKDGGSFSETATDLREPTRDEIITNYKRLAGPLLTQQQQDRSLELLLNIEKTDSISELMVILVRVGYAVSTVMRCEPLRDQFPASSRSLTCSV